MHYHADAIDYLKQGSAQQRAAYQVLRKLGILRALARYDARLAGTIPLDVALPESDLDIICQVAEEEQDAFAARLQQLYGHHPHFELQRKSRYGHAVVVCDFKFERFPVQVYASPTRVDAQRAWVHLLAEAHLLAHGRAGDKEAIRALKMQGIKTEPAFVQHFGLGNPNDAYEILYQLGKNIPAIPKTQGK